MTHRIFPWWVIGLFFVGNIAGLAARVDGDRVWLSIAGLICSSFLLGSMAEQAWQKGAADDS